MIEALIGIAVIALFALVMLGISHHQAAKKKHAH